MRGESGERGGVKEERVEGEQQQRDARKGWKSTSQQRKVVDGMLRGLNRGRELGTRKEPVGGRKGARQAMGRSKRECTSCPSPRSPFPSPYIPPCPLTFLLRVLPLALVPPSSCSMRRSPTKLREGERGQESGGWRAGRFSVFLWSALSPS